MSDLMTVDEVAEYLQIPVQTLYQWRHQGKGPRAAKIGRYLRYRRAEVEAWVNAQFEDI